MAKVVAQSVATPTDPAWRQCHASTLLHMPDGDLLCSWFAGEAEGSIDNSIWLARGSRDGAGWRFEDAEEMTDFADAHWNPVLGQAPGGEVALFYKVGRPISRWQTWVRRSEDGRLWSRPEELVPGDVGGRGPVKNPPVVSRDGAWVAPASVEAAPEAGRPAVWDCFADVSRDGGVTWQASSPFPINHATFEGAGMIQPTIWVGQDGRLHALTRTTAGAAWRSTSTDGGCSWSVAEPTSLPNNNSGLCAVAHVDGTVFCAHNTSDVSWGPRNELVLSKSTDDGRTWEALCEIERLPESHEGFDGQDAGVVTGGQGELSYPTLIVDAADPGRLLVSYTRERSAIAVATIEL
ncbi:exo-alpha-sialidase [Pedococcus sp. 2YAF34]|uniref:exo-alpha-sialidase n=1 Tax=Pedococcus sp. 2YAF34 TaxID=3233032 RepID=UPI003F9E3392